MATILASIPGGVEATSEPAARWQDAMRAAVRSSRELLRLLDLPESDASDAAEADFPVFVPREFIARMHPGDPQDPLLRQVLASPEEASKQFSEGASSFMPRVETAGVPTRMPPGLKMGRVSKGMPFLLTVMPA